MRPLDQSKPSKPSKPKFMRTIAAVSQIGRVNLVEPPKQFALTNKDFIQIHFWGNKILFITCLQIQAQNLCIAT